MHAPNEKTVGRRKVGRELEDPSQLGRPLQLRRKPTTAPPLRRSMSRSPSRLDRLLARARR